MDKAVLMSINPKWCELIASGKKNVEIRKTKPKLKTPFKCYIYCTKRQRGLPWRWGGGIWYDTQFPNERPNRLDGKVIGEFVCDEIYTINKDSCGWFYGTETDLIGIGYAEDIDELWHCIPEAELIRYLGGRVGFGWHISDLVIYDKPKELSRFQKPCICKTEYEGEEYRDCLVCNLAGDSDYGVVACNRPITRPPQSWCYVENHSSSF